jgi:hypothetical protein
MLRRLIATTALILLTASFVAASQGKGKGRGNGGGHDKGRTAVNVDIFVGQDQRVLRDYVTGYRGDLPPGLAKRNGNLPPGLMKQLRRKGHLPPGLEKQLVPFPPDLERRMSPLQSGLQRGFISGRAVIYNPSTRLIFDIFIPLN